MMTAMHLHRTISTNTANKKIGCAEAHPIFLFGAFRCGNKPLVLPGVKDGFSKAKMGELKASPKG